MDKIGSLGQVRKTNLALAALEAEKPWLFEGLRFDNFVTELKEKGEESMSKEKQTITSDVLTVQEVADVLRVTYQTILREIHRGKLTAARIGSTYRIMKPDLIEYFRRSGGGELFSGDCNGGDC